MRGAHAAFARGNSEINALLPHIGSGLTAVDAAGLPVTVVQDDLLSFERHLDSRVDLILIMGDTLTHLPDRSAVLTLLSQAAESLRPGGRFIATFRDYTSPLAGVGRFIPVKSDENRIWTCLGGRCTSRRRLQRAARGRPLWDDPSHRDTRLTGTRKMGKRTVTALFVPAVCAAMLIAAPRDTRAWSQDGHMVMGAIAYEELQARDPRVVARIVDLMSQHPDRGPFEVAAGGATGEARDRRLFMEMARWPDDIRKGMYDHPTWHYASKPLIDPVHPPAAIPAAALGGSAIEAFALNLSVARDPRAPAPERAIALCWIFHLVGDIHQPLHAADQYSAAHPDGDHGGGLQYILDPQSHRPLSLHWYWDSAVTESSDAAQGRQDQARIGEARAHDLRSQLPRKEFSNLAHHSDAPNDFTVWAAESYELARTQVYRPDLSTSVDESHPPALPAAYVANSAALAERRLTLSAYRLADLLIAVLPD